MSHELTILLAIGLPLIGAVGIVLAGQTHQNLRETVTLLTSLGLFGLVWSLLPATIEGTRPYLELMEVLPGLAIEFRVEPLGMLFAALASLLWVVNSIYSIGYVRTNQERHQTRFYACFAIALSASIGVAFGGNLLTLFLFYEILTLSTYPLVAHKGGAKDVASARVYLGVLLATSIGLFLPAIIWTYHLTGNLSFEIGGILEGHIDGLMVGFLLLLFVFGIGKAAIMPVHRWLPAAMVAPTPVSALLHAVAVVKAGVFAITKVVIYVFGTDFLLAEPSASWLVYAAAFTIVSASIVAMRQSNIKRLLAYSTIAQLSYVIMAVALLKPLALIGAAVHMVTHGLGKITLFFAAGAIYTASKKTEIYQLNGIGLRMPWTMSAFTIGALSMIGLPPTAGVISKWYILGGAFQAENMTALFVIIASTVLNSAYFLPIIYRAWFLPPDQSNSSMHGEAPSPMVLALTMTAWLTLAFFLFSGPVIDLAAQLISPTL